MRVLVTGATRFVGGHLVPFVRNRPLLVAGLLWHVLAVTLVSGASIVLLARSKSARPATYRTY